MPHAAVTDERRRRELEAKILRVDNSPNPAFEAELIAREDRDRERLRHDPRAYLPPPVVRPSSVRIVPNTRAPRARRRVVRSRARSPGRKSDDGPEPDDLVVPAATAPPAIVVTFELEAAPKVIAAWSTDADEARMTEWLDAHPEYAELLHRAVELSGEAA